MVFSVLEDLSFQGCSSFCEKMDDITTEAHGLKAFHSGSELGFFEFNNFLIWM